MIKHDRLELSSPRSADIAPLTGVAITEPSTVVDSGDGTEDTDTGKGNMVATPSENSDEFCTTLINIPRRTSSRIMILS